MPVETRRHERAFGWVGRLARGQRGQDLVELTILTPLLLLIVLGIIEFGSLLDSQQAMSYLSREGANIASRGAPLGEVLTVTMADRPGALGDFATVLWEADVNIETIYVIDTAGGFTELAIGVDKIEEARDLPLGQY